MRIWKMNQCSTSPLNWPLPKIPPIPLGIDMLTHHVVAAVVRKVHAIAQPQNHQGDIY